MAHDISFVTAIYDNLSTTEFGGRNNRGAHYAFSLAQIHSMGSPIYCFTDEINFNGMFSALYNRGRENYHFINYRLENYPLHAGIQHVKSLNPDYRESSAWISRCVEIMWGKFDWLKHVIEMNGVTEDKFTFWIDAGLSHGGILPKKLNSEYGHRELRSFGNAGLEYAKHFEFDRAFNKNLPEYLVEYAGTDRLFFFFCTCPQHNDVSHLVLPALPKRGTVVGGLFGGNNKMLYEWVKEAIMICHDLIAHNYLVKEEEIMTYMLNKHLIEDPNFNTKFTSYDFQTWYHEDWLRDWKANLYNPEEEKTFAEFFTPFIEKYEV